MSRAGRRSLHIVGYVVASVVVLLAVAGVALLVLTNTSWGRERVRRQVVSLLDDPAHRRVHIGRVDGNLLRGVIATDVSITDSAGAPFVTADSVSTRLDLAALLDKRIVLRDVRMVRPLIVVEQPPDGEWNFARIFPSDTTAPPDSTPGWGSWLRLEDVSVTDGHVIARLPWSPDSGLTEVARDSVIAAALSPDSRTNVEAVPGGWQTIYDLRHLTGRFPRVRVSDPGEPAMLVEVAALSTEAYPFRPPAAMVRDLRGTFNVNGDSLWFQDVAAEFPATRAAGAGTVVFGGRTEVRLAVPELDPGDLRWLYPALPEDGSGSLDVAVLMDADSSSYMVRDAHVILDSATVNGDIGIVLHGDTLHLVGTDVTFAALSTSLIEQLAPGVTIPRRGILDGHAVLDGTLSALKVDADVTFNDTEAGRNRVLANGLLGWDDGVFSADDLRVQLRPVQVALARMMDPTLPVGGVVTGSATLNGATSGRLRARYDLAHSDVTGVSNLAGTGWVRQVPDLTYEMDAQLLPLTMATAGLFAPALELRGTASGPLHVEGSSDGISFDADLGVSGGGHIVANGTLSLGETPSYDLRTSLQLFDASALTGRAPSTSITGELTVDGSGFDPATMSATIVAQLAASRVDTVGTDSALARVAIADGMARVDTLAVYGPSTFVSASGDFGLRADREGTLVYRVSVDSLKAYAGLLATADTTEVAARPRLAARALATAVADSARVAAETEVERMATGVAAPQIAVAAELPPIPRDSVGGSLYAAGKARGNLEGVDVRGRLAIENLVLRGNAVRRARAEYAWVNGLTEQAAIIGALKADSLRALGLALDSADIRVAYQSERGTADIVIVQDDTVDYRARANFHLTLDESEVSLQQLALRIDTTRWVATHPSAVRWGGGRLQVDNVELRAGPEQRIFADGTVPTEGVADLKLSIRGFQVDDIVRLAQSDIPLSGILGVEAEVTGTANSPIINATAEFGQGAYDDTPIPDVRVAFDYENDLLGARAQLSRPGDSTSKPIVLADASVPLNLAFQTTAPRLPDLPLQVNVDADSLPIGLLGEFTDVVANVDGLAAGAMRVRGTVKSPEFVGALTLSNGSALVVPAGMSLHSISGRIRLVGDTVMVDSLVAFNAGRILVRGGIGIKEIASPSFDLYLVANGATVLNNEMGRVRVDAGLNMRGPFDNVYISGAARVTEGVIYLPEGTGNEALASDDPALTTVVDTSMVGEAALLPQVSPLLQNLRVGVSLAIARDTWVRSGDANVEIYTPEDLGPLDVELDQSKGRLLVRGVVSTERGEYSFLSKRFQVDRGSVIFTGTPDLNPLLQITALYEVKLPAQQALTIKILIGGTLDTPKLTLDSDAQPPLPQSDLISYLAFGRTSSSLLQLNGSGLSGGNEGGGIVGAVGAAATQRLGAIALGVLVDQLEGQTSRSLGADVVNITPADLTIEASNPFSGLDALVRGTQFEIGKYFNRNTFVSFTVRPSILAREGSNRSIPGVRVEHRLGAGFKLDTSFEGRFLIQPPTLESSQQTTSSGVFGLFLTREWGW